MKHGVYYSVCAYVCVSVPVNQIGSVVCREAPWAAWYRLIGGIFWRCPAHIMGLIGTKSCKCDLRFLEAWASAFTLNIYNSAFAACLIKTAFTLVCIGSLANTCLIHWWLCMQFVLMAIWQCCWQVWSSGRIAHIPLYYVPRRLIGHSQDAPFTKQLPTSTSLFST